MSDPALKCIVRCGETYLAECEAALGGEGIFATKKKGNSDDYIKYHSAFAGAAGLLSAQYRRVNYILFVLKIVG